VFAEPVTVSCVAETYVVLSGAPARRTCEVLRKLLPVIVRFSAPVLTEVGLMEVRTGVGLRRVTVAEAVAVESAELVAWIVTVFGLGRVVGAV